MRSAKFTSASPSYLLWILTCAMSLILFVSVSQSLFRDHRIPAATEDVQVSVSVPSKGQGYPPVLAYWISGTSGDSKRMMRLLRSIYHPRNRYLLQLDSQATYEEREELLLLIRSDRVLRSFGNVDVVGKSYAINKMGSSALSAMLHAAALLLKLNKDWDWFINLSAADYPLVSQDDLLHAFTSLPRDLNFLTFYNGTSWKEEKNIYQVVVDPSLHLLKTSHLYYAVEKRPSPDAFDIFGGSPWMILTRSLLEYCIQAHENLPRKLLMYFSNTAYPTQYYFHTVICNSPEFQNTSAITNLRYHIPSNYEYHEGSATQLRNMLASRGAAFARPFHEHDAILDELDRDVLNRLSDRVVPGKWCLVQGMNDTNVEEGSSTDQVDLCSTWSNNTNVVGPGDYGLKLGVLLSELVNEVGLKINQCH